MMCGVCEEDGAMETTSKFSAHLVDPSLGGPSRGTRANRE